MRYRLDERRLLPTQLPPLSESMESEFASLVAKIDEVIEQFDVGIVAVEEADTVAHAVRVVEKIAVRKAWRL